MNIFIWNQLSSNEKKSLLSRPGIKYQEALQIQVQNILQQVKIGGDQTLKELTARYDSVELKNLQANTTEFQEAAAQVDNNIMDAIIFAKKQIENNQKNQLPQNQITHQGTDLYCERQTRPIERVGLYIPGGSAPLVSTVLMLAVPAQIANCALRIICTPPNSLGKINPYILMTAKLCGIQNVYKVGGAQAVAAMAYGTTTIPKVDKIFGPGNSWVTQAKKFVAQDPEGASIDLSAGASEILVIADQYANAEYVAADLLSQAEHGVDSQVLLLTDSREFSQRTAIALNKQLINLSRRDIAQQSLAHSRIIVVENINEAIELSNSYAPEHLSLQIENPENYTQLIQNAGAVFIGSYTPETLGDYVTGSNHVLPTNGYARTFSGLSVNDFMKFISFQKATRAGLEKIGPYAEKIAIIEGLQAHKEAVSIRLRQLVTTDE